MTNTKNKQKCQCSPRRKKKIEGMLFVHILAVQNSCKYEMPNCKISWLTKEKKKQLALVGFVLLGEAAARTCET